MVKEELESKEQDVKKEKIALEMDAVVEISNKEYLQNKKNAVKFEETLMLGGIKNKVSNHNSTLILRLLCHCYNE